MPNLLLQPVEYQVTTSERGTWRRYLHPSGNLFAEFTSSATVLGVPLLHYSQGISPETGSAAVSRGFLAVGPRAIGVISVGRIAVGALAVGQLCVGLLALGQLAIGVGVLGQMALGVAFGVGQLATGYVCIAQVGFGNWVLAQLGAGRHVWSITIKDPQAIEFFRSLAGSLGVHAIG
jgi:hypothetical protein